MFCSVISETEMSSGLMGHLACMQILPFPWYHSMTEFQYFYITFITWRRSAHSNCENITIDFVFNNIHQLVPVLRSSNSFSCSSCCSLTSSLPSLMSDSKRFLTSSSLDFKPFILLTHASTKKEEKKKILTHGSLLILIISYVPRKNMLRNN